MKHGSLLWLLILLLSACDKEELPADKQNVGKPVVQTSDKFETKAVKITTVKSQQRDIEIIERGLGRIVDPIAVTIGAEIPGKVVQVLVDAGEAVTQGQLLALLDDKDEKSAVANAQSAVHRLLSQQQTQKKLLDRYRTLIEKHFISPTLLEQAEAQLDVLSQSRLAALSRLNQAKHNLNRTRVKAPITGRIDKRLVAAGDYIGLGKALFRMASSAELTVSIRLPETRATRIHRGQVVHLRLPSDNQQVSAKISDLTPMVGADNAFEVRVKLQNPGHWRPGGSVMAAIITGVHRHAVVVPERSVVLRPTGRVVYRIEHGVARAVHVVVGEQREGMVELRSGLAAAVELAEEGAAYLSDGVKVDSSKREMNSDGSGI
ncbi:MAG: efflux RND transporter periplasmic adaptor subunit [Mariprofundus sp.]|nr:efflux RND transporter periplasmic adaptor subunit [Mariprofundus sp.]